MLSFKKYTTSAHYMHDLDTGITAVNKVKFAHSGTDNLVFRDRNQCVNKNMNWNISIKKMNSKMGNRRKSEKSESEAEREASILDCSLH